MVRVVVVSPFTKQAGGAELSLLHLFEHGRGLGVKWSLAVTQDGPMRERVAAMGVPTKVVGGGRVSRPHEHLAGVTRLARFARRQNANVILSWNNHNHLLGYPAAKLAGTRSAWFQKGGVEPASRRQRLLCRLPSDAVFANSLFTAREQFPMVSDRPMFVAPSGVDPNVFNPSVLGTPGECRRRLGLPEDGPLIVTVGRMQFWKGMHVVIAAMARVRRHVPDAKLVIVGGPFAAEPGYESRLRQDVADANLEANVIFAGAVDHDEVPRYMQAAEVIVHASRREPFGIVVVEAMTLGKPTVAADRGGPVEIITHGVDGLLAPFGNEAKLAETLVSILSDLAFAKQLGAAAKQRAADFTTAVFARRVADAARAVCYPPPVGVYLDGKEVAL